MALIGFDEYHMGPSMANPDADGLSSFAKILEKSNHKLEMIQDEYDITQELPWDVIVIPFPKEKFSVEEMMALQTHLRSGKSILLLAEWGDLYGHVDYLNELTKTFGIEIQKDRVTDHQQHITKKMELGGFHIHKQNYKISVL